MESLAPTCFRLKRWATLTVVTGCGLMAGCGSVRWEMDYARGLREAVQHRRRALIQFHSGASADCRDMDFNVFTNAKVQETIKEFVPIRLDIWLNRDIARQYGVERVPAFIVVRPDGSVAGAHVGKLDEERFRVFLIRHRYN